MARKLCSFPVDHSSRAAPRRQRLCPRPPGGEFRAILENEVVAVHPTPTTTQEGHYAQANREVVAVARGWSEAVRRHRPGRRFPRARPQMVGVSGDRGARHLAAPTSPPTVAASSAQKSALESEAGDLAAYSNSAAPQRDSGSCPASSRCGCRPWPSRGKVGIGAVSSPKPSIAGQSRGFVAIQWAGTCKGGITSFAHRPRGEAGPF